MPVHASHLRQLAVVLFAVTMTSTACGTNGVVVGRSETAAAQPLPLPPRPTEPTRATSVPGTTAPKRPTQTKPPPVGPADVTTGLGVAGSLGPPWPDHFTAADAVVGRVALYQAPGRLAPTGASLPNPTVEGLPLVFLVRQEQPEWLQVQIQSRPNGATAWIKRTDVVTRRVENHIVIARAARRITLMHGNQEIMQDVAAVGKDSSPTPLGSFFVDGVVKLADPTGPYGVYQISFTGFSDVYQRFGSGNGQVAAHGTNRPSLLGTPASHGCVRLSNEAITRLVPFAPTGTPVEVVP